MHLRVNSLNNLHFFNYHACRSVRVQKLIIRGHLGRSNREGRGGGGEEEEEEEVCVDYFCNQISQINSRVIIFLVVSFRSLCDNYVLFMP